MKNLFATAIVLVSVFASINSATASVFTDIATVKEPVARKIDANNVHTSSKAFGVGMYQIKGTESIKLMVETSQKLTVKITDEKGYILNREAMKTSGAININLSDVPAGEYFVEVSNGTETITRQISKSKASITTEQ
jgi:Secretion system C-terminal sorting domain